MTEQWAAGPIVNGRQSATVTGRTLVPWRKKANPLWWFSNDDDPSPPAWYAPAYPQWLRVALWYVRNPLHNFGGYVVGVRDRNYTVIGTAPVMESNTPGAGWKWAVIKLGWLRLPYVSLETSAYIFYAGFQYWGYFGFKFNFKNSGSQVA